MNRHQIRNDINEVQPLSLHHIIGQKQVTDVLRVHVDAHFKIRATKQDGTSSFGPVALLGPTGTGKTLVANVIHAELGNLRWCQTNGQALNQINVLSSLLLNADEHTTIFIDEAHGLNSKVQDTLLTAISERYLPVPDSQYVIPLNPFALIIATTDEYRLQEPFRGRMRIRCRFRLYTVPELVGILRQRADTLGWKYEPEQVFQMIASRAKGTARIALNFLQTCWEVSQNNDRKRIMVSDVREAFFLLQVDSLGLEDIDRDYLRVLSQRNYTALNVISSHLSVPPKTIQDSIEPYLIREHLITKNSNSLRGLTQKGEQHLKTTDQSHSAEGTTDGNFNIQ